MTLNELDRLNKKLNNYFKENRKSLTEEQKNAFRIVFSMLGSSIVNGIHEEEKGEKK